MRIVISGPPGVGKGTYASYIKKKYKITYISIGDLFREAVAKNNELGKKVKKYINKGVLVPDNLTIDILKQRLAREDCKKDFLLDGFPRNLKQAKELEKITKIDLVLNFYASESVILQRLSGRRICKKCGAIFHMINRIPKKIGICDECQGELYQRSDEMPRVIKRRLAVYYKQTKPLENYYRKKGILKEIKADTDMNELNFKKDILDRIDEAIKSVK